MVSFESAEGALFVFRIRLSTGLCVREMTTVEWGKTVIGVAGVKD